MVSYKSCGPKIILSLALSSANSTPASQLHLQQTQPSIRLELKYHYF